MLKINIHKMLDQIIQYYYERELPLNFVETPESILSITKDALDWVHNDLCGILYNTKYQKTHFYALTDEEKEHYYENYYQFEDYLNIPADDIPAQKNKLRLLCEEFTQEELITLLP